MRLFQREAWTFTTNGKRIIWLLIAFSLMILLLMPSFPEELKAALYSLVLGRAWPVLLVLSPALRAFLIRGRRLEGAAGVLQQARVEELSRTLWLHTVLGLLLVLPVMLFRNDFALLVALLLCLHLEINLLRPLRTAKKDFTARREASLAPRNAENVVPRAAWGVAWAGWLLAVGIAWPVLSYHAVFFFMFAALQLVLGPVLVRRSLQQLERPSLQHPVLAPRAVWGVALGGLMALWGSYVVGSIAFAGYLLVPLVFCLLQRPEPPSLQHPEFARRVNGWGLYCITLSFTIPITGYALAVARGWSTQWFGLGLITAFLVSLVIGVAAYHLQQPHKTDEPREPPSASGAPE